VVGAASPFPGTTLYVASHLAPLKGCAATSPNREGLDMDSISDDRLQASGEVVYATKYNVFVSARKSVEKGTLVEENSLHSSFTTLQSFVFSSPGRGDPVAASARRKSLGGNSTIPSVKMVSSYQ